MYYCYSAQLFTYSVIQLIVIQQKFSSIIIDQKYLPSQKWLVSRNKWQTCFTMMQRSHRCRQWFGDLSCITPPSKKTKVTHRMLHVWFITRPSIGGSIKRCTPVRLSVCPSVRHVPLPRNRKTVETSNRVELWPRSRVTRGANVKSKHQRSRSLRAKM